MGKLTEPFATARIFGADNRTFENTLCITAHLLEYTKQFTERTKALGKNFLLGSNVLLVTLKLRFQSFTAGFFFPLPNTEITRQLEKEGKVVYDDAFLKLPIYVHNTFLSEDRKYNENFTAKELTRWKYKVVRAFYTRSLLLRPSRWFRIFWNFVRGKETSKMESFLKETMRKLRLRKKPNETPKKAAKPTTQVSTGGPVSRNPSRLSPPGVFVACEARVRDRLSGLYWNGCTRCTWRPSASITTKPPLRTLGERG